MTIANHPIKQDTIALIKKIAEKKKNDHKFYPK